MAFLETHKDYMKVQYYLTQIEREALINWIIEIQRKSKGRMSNFTLHLAVNIMDRYLSKYIVRLSDFQCVGGVALMIAYKFWDADIHSSFKPTDVEFLCDELYSIDEITYLEREILKAIDYHLMICDASQIILKQTQEEEEINIANYLSELALIDYTCSVSYTPEKIADSALNIARSKLQGNTLSSDHITQRLLELHSTGGKNQEQVRLKHQITIESYFT